MFLIGCLDNWLPNTLIPFTEIKSSGLITSSFLEFLFLGLINSNRKEDKKIIFSKYLYKNNIDHAKYFYRSCDAIECFKDLGNNCINSQFISKNIILLPIHNEIDDNRIKENINIINLFLK